ncbi:NYN domain-containing protein [Natronincola ferrireducens]|uniref:NYN domain-containing protein n=1 Tax=Natronincola ferrireducens TaxID=393762 RepID=A0A1G9IMY2_9FIRM|nr:NYN domain-containing protein [Natronincola ferrireducens]SDL26628.1 hypothetical protein SAMN05660472_02902 [Natronincola ferrireducens]
MKEYVVVDGYNVINGWPDLKKLAEENLEEARIELIDRMAEYRSFRGIKVIVVFDAHLVKGSMEKNDKIKGVEIVYTKEKQTADSYIEKLIPQLTVKKRVAVVTNDWTEQQMILGGGATRISVRELILDYQATKTNIHQKTEMMQQQRDSLWNRIDPKILEKLEKFRRRS